MVFRRIAAEGPGLAIKLFGFDAEHAIERVGFEALRLRGKEVEAASSAPIQRNEFVRRIDFSVE